MHSSIYSGTWNQWTMLSAKILCLCYTLSFYLVLSLFKTRFTKLAKTRASLAYMPCHKTLQNITLEQANIFATLYGVHTGCSKILNYWGYHTITKHIITFFMVFWRWKCFTSFWKVSGGGVLIFISTPIWWHNIRTVSFPEK